MPNKFVTLDTGFPTFSNNASTSEKVDGIMSYLYQLQESLRYMLRHLGSDNFDEEGLLSITEPISISLREDFNSTQIDIDASGLSAVLEGLETTLSAYVKADTFNVAIESLDGDISKLTQTVGGFEAVVEQQDEKIAAIELTADGFKATAEDLDTRMSTTLHLTSGGLKIGSSDGTSTKISGSNITTGSITATQIKSGTITGDKIAANTITADKLKVDEIVAGKVKGEVIYIEDDTGGGVGAFYTTDTENGNGLALESEAGLKMRSNGNVYIRAHKQYAGPSPEIILQWTDANDPLSSSITLQGGILLLGDKIYGNNLPNPGKTGQIYFYGPV